MTPIQLIRDHFVGKIYVRSLSYGDYQQDDCIGKGPYDLSPDGVIISLSDFDFRGAVIRNAEIIANEGDGLIRLTFQNFVSITIWPHEDIKLEEKEE